MLTSEQFQEWKTNAVTIEILTELRKVRKVMESKLSNGNTIGQNAYETHGMTNRVVGNIEGLDQILNISFEGDSVENDVDQVSGYQVYTFVEDNNYLKG